MLAAQALDEQTSAAFAEHEAKLGQQQEALARQSQKGITTLQVMPLPLPLYITPECCIVLGNIILPSSHPPRSVLTRLFPCLADFIYNKQGPTVHVRCSLGA